AVKVWDFITGGGDDVRGIVQNVAKSFGWGSGPLWDALAWLIGKESSWNPKAQNPKSTAYGLFQFLDSTWASVGGRKTSDPTAQA
ncbi:transglycosylase SLT domain-containing protein, partial [Salmonella enterica]|uniref:aggregation-promoting factor C-terminal-like domain-containing protein n=1 Tax=Salmonella enterica TaxID=28901 RepID=UPI0032970145